MYFYLLLLKTFVVIELLSSLLIGKFDFVIIIIIFNTIVTTQMLQIASFLYFVSVLFTHAHLVIGPRAVELAWK
jgi:hypothetical protein